MKRIGIRFRLMVLMICLTTLPVITVTWFATRNTIDSVEKEIVSGTISQMMWADQYLKELIEHIDILFYSLQIDQQFIQSIDEIGSKDISTQFRAQNYIQGLLTSVLYANSKKIENITVYINSNQKVYTVNFAGSMKPYTLDIKASHWNRITLKPINMYFECYDDNLTAFHSINRFEDKSLKGGISVRINSKVFDEVQEILKSSAKKPVFILNDQGKLLTNNHKEYLAQLEKQLGIKDLTHSDIVVQKTDQYYYFIKRVRNGQLTIIKTIPIEIITQSAYSTIKAGIFTSALFTVLSVLLAILFSFKITGPIISLAKTMRMAQIQNFELKTVKNRDEIGLLEHGYNSMMRQIKKLIKDEYEKSIELKNAQLMALQAQINPHFLNNTLQLIGGIALSNNVPEIYRLTKVIGDLLRYSISADGDLVLLKDELKHMRNYLFIQENRFEGRCGIVDSVDERLLESKIPKFTLQPILENAFDHGLQKKEGSWKIVIRGKCIGNRIVIMIKDNGIGLSTERLIKIRKDLKEGYETNKHESGLNNPRKRKGIGLRNVNSRLKLHFGQKYGCRIFSKTGAGTLVVLMIPVFVKEDGEDA